MRGRETGRETDRLLVCVGERVERWGEGRREGEREGGRELAQGEAWCEYDVLDNRQ